jgi:tRNA pseudouridine55 synthase
MKGILLVDKPLKWTSFDVVAFIRRIVASELNLKPKNIKVGHTGTLDPLASGLLVILIGKEYTRLAEKYTKLDKEYIVELKLGEKSDSADLETEPFFVSDKVPTLASLQNCISSFIGTSLQTPPIYSAIKVDGRRAYSLARQGKELELKARPVTIYSIELTSYDYPKVVLKTKVSSGTYIRSLVTDIGDKLAVGAVMTKLSRTEIGDFKLKDSISLQNLDFKQIEAKIVST